MDFNLQQLSDTKVEAGVIGTLFVHPEYLERYEIMDSKWFYNYENACLFWAIKHLVFDKSAKSIDAFNLSMAINSNEYVKKTFEKYNMPNFEETIQLYSACARNSIGEFESLALSLLNMSYRRNFVKMMDGFKVKCFDPSTNVDQIGSELYDQIDKLTSQYISNDEVKKFGDVIDGVFESILKDQKNDGTCGIPSKYPAFDKYFTYDKGELVVVEARLKQGKSTLLMNEAVDKALKGIPTLIVDTEMNDKIFTLRLLSHLSGISTDMIKRGNYQDHRQKQKVEDAISIVKKMPLVHLYQEEIDLNRIFIECKRLKRTIGLQFVVFDYIKSDSDDAYNELGKMTNFLKNRIAGGLDMAVLSACQLNRNDQVADSDKIERYMSTAIYWRRKTNAEIERDTPAAGNFMAQIKVNRNGESMDDPEYDYIDFSFRGDCMMISQAQDHRLFRDI